jgi:Phosphoglucomutase/phosphomannomutase, C-terminal domain
MNEPGSAVLTTRRPRSGSPFALRLSGTECLTKIYTESYLSEARLNRISNEANEFAQNKLGARAYAAVPPPHEPTEREAVEAWEHEGDPN